MGLILHQASDSSSNGLGITSESYFSDDLNPAPRKQSISDARKKVSWPLFELLFQEINRKNPIQSWKGHSVKVLDGTKIRLPHTQELIETFGQLSSQHGPNHYPSAHMLLLIDALSGRPIDVNIGPCNASERDLAFEIIQRLKIHDLVLLDRGLGGQKIYNIFCDKNIFFIHRAQINGKHRPSYLRDFIKSGKQSSVQFISPASNPNPILLRLVRGEKRNNEEIIYVTNLIDEEIYSSNEIHQMYARRWEVETSIGHLKTSLNLEGIGSKSSNLVKQDIFARLIVLALATQARSQACEELELQRNQQEPSLKNIFSLLKRKMFSLFSGIGVTEIWQWIVSCSKRVIWVKQPNRSRPRFSWQPQNRWSSERYRKKKNHPAIP